MECLKKVKAAFPNTPVIAGNIATAEAAEALIQAGADAVKVVLGQVLSVPLGLLLVLVFRRLPLFMTLLVLQRSMAFRHR